MPFAYAFFAHFALFRLLHLVSPDSRLQPPPALPSPPMLLYAQLLKLIKRKGAGGEPIAAPGGGRGVAGAGGLGGGSFSRGSGGDARLDDLVAAVCAHARGRGRRLAESSRLPVQAEPSPAYLPPRHSQLPVAGPAVGERQLTKRPQSEKGLGTGRGQSLRQRTANLRGQKT